MKGNIVLATNKKATNREVLGELATNDMIYFACCLSLIVYLCYFAGILSLPSANMISCSVSLPAWCRFLFQRFFRGGEKTESPVSPNFASPKGDIRKLKDHKEDDLGFEDDKTQLLTEQGMKPWEADAAALLEVLRNFKKK